MENKEVYMAHDTKLDVPYFSQYKDVQDPDHRLRSCGITCAYMVLKYFGATVPSLDELVEEGMRGGGFSKFGWVHEHFVKLFNLYGHACERHENMREKDVELFRTAIKNGNPVMVSAVRKLWDQRIFHMVVLTGIREGARGELEGFFYHDPASLLDEGAQHLYVPLKTFFLDWRRMAILPERQMQAA